MATEVSNPPEYARTTRSLMTVPPGPLREALRCATFPRRCAPQSRRRRAPLRSRQLLTHDRHTGLRDLVDVGVLAELVGQVAGDQVTDLALDRQQLGYLLVARAAVEHRVPAARMERAPGRQVDQARRVALDGYQVGVGVAVYRRNARQ